ncbi:MAG TPA: hypothetical protein VGS80_07770, partial [Ktedonobacterales bacterium]|nr:hypothetical protein [Ktedonobacterales bacterium]
METLEDYFEYLDPTQIRIKGHRIGIEHLRLSRRNAGGSDPLPLNCFRLRGADASQLRVVSGGPSTVRAVTLGWHRHG